jgi:fluoride exporter
VARFLLVCLGGALGSGARYLVATWAAAMFGPAFPRGTLIVNVAGSFLLSIVMTFATLTAAVPPTLRLFLAAGVMGGFTTYSSFNWETIALAQEGALGFAVLNLTLTVVLCLAAGLAGVVLVHRVVG